MLEGNVPETYFPTSWLDSPCRELNSEFPETRFIDLEQVVANLHQLMLKFIENHKMRLKQIQGRHFRTKKACWALHNIPKGLVTLFAANPSATGQA